jgi:hypothetical protein
MDGVHHAVTHRYRCRVEVLKLGCLVRLTVLVSWQFALRQDASFPSDIESSQKGMPRHRIVARVRRSPIQPQAVAPRLRTGI